MCELEHGYVDIAAAALTKLTFIVLGGSQVRGNTSLVTLLLDLYLHVWYNLYLWSHVSPVNVEAIPYSI